MFRFKEILFLLVILSFCSCRSNHTSNVITLNLVDNWEFKQSDSSEWRPAEVPGCIHTDLLNHNIIKDPHTGTNEKNVQWIEEMNWEYKTSFTLPDSILQKNQIQLIFEGLDTYTEIRLNDSLILKSENMFVCQKIECKQILKKNNTVQIIFYSPVNIEKEKFENYPYQLAGGQKVMTRKAGFHYGWDWGARLITSGIWRPIKLIAWDNVKINDVNITTKEIRKDHADLNAFIEYVSNENIDADLIIKINDIELSKDKIKLKKGNNTYQFSFQIKDPSLWWTNGLGDPYLYNIHFELTHKNRTLDSKTIKYGIRKIELVQEPDSIGETFYFKLNDVPVFMKGANYIPQDNFQNRVSKDKYDKLFETVVNSNMNMLRVWGGGIYEEDYFYELCDKNGILVWQDFMFACAMYPENDEFLKNVETEAEQNVKRLRNHPSVALWCGNNEIDEAWHNWGWSNNFSKKDSAKIWGGYKSLFHELIPNVLKKYDPGRPYISSSPKYGRGNPKSQHVGDSHYWGVWHDAEPFENFETKLPRFMSEFGFQSFPKLETIQQFADINEMSIDSEVMQSHQKHPRGNELIKQYLRDYYFIPDSLEHFIYLSQLLQAEGIKTGIEAHRRVRPYCGGTLYWQLNDCWPVVSWSGTDYSGNWKALQYFVMKSFEDIIISTYEKDNVVEVYIISDKLQDSSGKLNLRITDFKGKTLWSDTKDINVKGNESQVYYTIPSQLLHTVNKSTCVLISEFEAEDIIFKSFHYFVKAKELDLPKSVIKLLVTQEDNYFTLHITSDALLKNICLNSNTEGFFEDNFFDLEANELKAVKFIPKQKLSLDNLKFHFLSLNDLLP